MIDISEDKLRQIITQVVMEYLKADHREGDAPEQKPRKRAYVLCEAGRENQFLTFLRKNKSEGSLDLIAVLECPEGDIVRVLLEEGLCSVISAADSRNDPEAVMTIYPSFSRSALCEASLGIDHCFSAAFLRRDFEEGRRSVVITKGLDPFTGKEPAAYREKILAYIRELVRMEVCFTNSPFDVDTKASAAASSGANDNVVSERQEKKSLTAPALQTSGKAECYTLSTSNNLVSAMDLRKIPVGSSVYLAGSKIITPLAKDVIRDRKLTIIRA